MKEIKILTEEELNAAGHGWHKMMVKKINEMIIAINASQNKEWD